ncbi:MAG: RNase adapter RapZ [Clostridiales bacterium]|nr:MAG: RNase adapter RapZ [Clostridiales bacterium]
MNIKIITGLSGAGKSTAIKSLEDIGYYCIDNLPPALIMQFIKMCESLKQPIDKVALGIDARGYPFFEDIEQRLKLCLEQYEKSEIIFLDASDEVLINRFKETRRLHPFSVSGVLSDGIEIERHKMAVIKNMASQVIDTSKMNGHQLRRYIKVNVMGEAVDKAIAITFQSFGFKNGLPLDSDLLFDVRFLPNPYYDVELRNLTGNDQAIKDYVFKWRETHLFYDKLINLLDFLVAQYIKDGKNQLTISIGCTGGRHRSVAICNQLGADYGSRGYMRTIVHRDLK